MSCAIVVLVGALQQGFFGGEGAKERAHPHACKGGNLGRFRGVYALQGEAPEGRF